MHVWIHIKPELSQIHQLFVVVCTCDFEKQVNIYLTKIMYLNFGQHCQETF